MQEFLEGTPVAVHEVENQKTGTASAKKIVELTTRDNALKSTGPKTVARKAFIRKNAIKHGLFARSVMDFVAHGEDPQGILTNSWKGSATTTSQLGKPRSCGG